MADTLHGYEVVKFYLFPLQPCEQWNRMILVHRKGYTKEGWITASHNLDSPEWHWGHYFDSYDEAIVDFRKRVAARSLARFSEREPRRR